tara:strand:+ start:87001 stop:88533 length:1533 start_codon:yes stop_codon:yes gene_type:complete
MRALIFSLFLAIGLTAIYLTNMEKTMNINHKEIRVAFPMVDLGLDPHLLDDWFSMVVVLQVHRGLFRFAPSGELLPDIVETYSVSSDKKTYKFKLRPQNFSDGTPITARDVVNSFARIFYRNAAIGSDINYIKGASAFRDSENLEKLGIRSVSKDEVEFSLERPTSLFFTHLAAVDCAIVKMSSFKDNYSVQVGTPVSGPYRVESYSKNRVVLSKWREDQLESKKPPISLVFQGSEKQPVALGLNDEIDSLDHDVVTDSDKEKLLALGWTRSATEAVAEKFVLVNPKKVSNEVRAYLYSKVDSKRLVDDLQLDGLIPAHGLIPTGMPGELPEEGSPRPAGDSMSSPSGEILLEFVDSNPIDKSVAIYLKELWETNTFKVIMKAIDRQEQLKIVGDNDCNVCITGKGADYPDGYSILSYFESSYDGNFYGVSSAEIDKLLKSAVAEYDQVKRVELYLEIQKVILKENAIIPLFFGSKASGLWGPRIANVPAHPLGMHFLSFETIEMAGGVE